MLGRVALHPALDLLARPAEPADPETGHDPVLEAAQLGVARVVRLTAALLRHGLLRPADLTPAHVQRYLRRFPPERARVLLAAYEAAGRRPRHRYKSFLKLELLAKMRAALQDLVTSRAIQNPDAATTVSLGRWWLVVGEQLKLQWHAQHPITYTSGLNARELGRCVEAWLDHPDWVAIESDCSRWDGRYAHACALFFVLILLLWRVALYVVREEMRASFSLETELATFRVLFCRLSGVGQTSTGNSPSNAGCTLEALLGADPDLQQPFKLLVLGDDMLLLVLRAHPVRAADVAAAYAAVGHKPTVQESHTHPLRPTFCSGRFFHSTVGRVWAPKPGRVLAKGGWMLRFALSPLAWLRCAGHSLHHSSNHVPVVRAIATRYIELGGQATVSEVALFRRTQQGQAPSPTGPHTCSPQGLLEFCTLYDTTPAEIQEVEALIARSTYGAILDHPLLHRIVALDIEEPSDPVDAAGRCGADLVDLPARAHVPDACAPRTDPCELTIHEASQLIKPGLHEAMRLMRSALPLLRDIHARRSPDAVAQ